MTARWAVERVTGPASAFHARPLPEPVRRSAWVFAVHRPALVLGSTQPEAHVDRAACAAAAVEVVRRRSGGGAVLLRPGEVLWVDLVLPAGDPLWVDDVGAAFDWVGQAWVAALAEVGVTARAHAGPLVATPWSRHVCFAGLGPGEVTAADRKVVGVSQRRTRVGARFQCAALLRWDPAALVDLLALSPGERRAAATELAPVAAALPVAAPDLVAALLRHLP